MKTILFNDNSLKEFLNFREEIVESYINDNCKVVIVAPHNFQIPKELKNTSYHDINLNRGGMNPLNDLKLFFRYLNIYRKERPDYIFHYTIKPNIYGTFAASLCGIPSTAMVAGLGYVFTSNSLGCRIARNLYKFALKLSKNVIVLNEENKKFLIENNYVNPEKLILLRGGEGIDLSKFKEV